MRLLSSDGTRFEFHFPYSPEINAALKARCGGRWDSAERIWWAPLAAVTAVTEIAVEYGFEPDQLAQQAMQAVDVLHEASRSVDSTFDVPSLAGELRPFQKAGVEYAVNAKRVLIADSMGLGKTIEALATLEALDAYPVLVVTTATQKLGWVREIKKWLPHRSVGLVDKELPETDICVINYDLLDPRHDVLGMSKETYTNGKTHVYYRRELEHFKAVVLDESHKVKSRNAIRSKVAKALAKDLDVIIALTGTPIVNRPVELVSQLEILGRLEDFGGWKKFVDRYCGAYRDRFGYRTEGATNLEELDRRLRATCMVRRDKAEVYDELPAKQRTVVPLDIDNRFEYEWMEEKFIEWLGQQAYNDAEFLKTLDGLSAEEAETKRIQYAASAQIRARRAEELVKLAELRRVAAKGKFKNIVAWVEEFLESGEKLILYAWHQEIQEALLASFPDAAHILASDSSKERDKNVEKFQTEDDCQLIICSIGAGSEGWTGTAASNVAFAELGWTPGIHEQAEDRCYGRVNDPHGVSAYYLLAEGTIDEKLSALIEAKRWVIQSATGTKEDVEGTIVLELIEQYRKGDS